MEDTTWPS